MAKKILIVGGGLAGTIVANGLCRQLREELSSGSIALSNDGHDPARYVPDSSALHALRSHGEGTS